MAAAFSIISLVIFFAPCVCACAHRTPGNSVPAKPIPEQVFMKFRRSSMVLLPFEFFFRRVPYHTNSSTRGADRLFRTGAGKDISPIGKLLYDAGLSKGVSMTRFAKCLVLLSVLLLTFSIRQLQTTQAGNPPAEGKEAALKAADITAKLFPEKVFFRGQSAPVQFRNTGGV